MKKIKQQNAITLIALIITIIILLILAVVTIGSIKNSDIITYAQNAAADYETEKGKEESILSGYESLIQDKLPTWTDNGDGTFTSINGAVVAIGDYVDYSYDTAEYYYIDKKYDGTNSSGNHYQTASLQWQILGLNENGKMELISAAPTDYLLTLQDSTGYNNGVYLMNDICKSHYSNSNLGTIARSLSIKDLEKQYSEAGIKAKKEYRNDSSNSVLYGSTMVCSSGNKQYPTLYAEEVGSGVAGSIRSGGIDTSESYYKNKESLSVAYDEEGNKISTSKAMVSGDLMVTQTAYSFRETPSNYFKNETFYNMIFAFQTGYWLASRSVDVYGDTAQFGFQIVLRDNIYQNYTFTSTNNTPHYPSNALRPVVTLPSDVSIITNNETNSSTNMWTLSK